MSDPPEPPPRVTVHLPGGRTIGGRIHRWVQAPDGRWWAEVSVPVPADAVRQTDGEDYTQVPREPAPPRHVVATDTRATPPRMELHEAGCWTIRDPASWLRITPVVDVDPELVLRFPDTVACTVCMLPEETQPRPDAGGR